MRLWARQGTGDAAIDEFEEYMRLLGWHMKAEYHREARSPVPAFACPLVAPSGPSTRKTLIEPHALP